MSFTYHLTFTVSNKIDYAIDYATHFAHNDDTSQIGRWQPE
jgi:hypothetical protein